MKIKNNRMEALKMLISSMELGSQEEVLQALEKEGFRYLVIVQDDDAGSNLPKRR